MVNLKLYEEFEEGAYSVGGFKRIKIHQEDFEKLINGEEVRFKDDKVAMILADIGYDNMINIINKAKAKK